MAELQYRLLIGQLSYSPWLAGAQRPQHVNKLSPEAITSHLEPEGLGSLHLFLQSVSYRQGKAWDGTRVILGKYLSVGFSFKATSVLPL